MFQKFHMTSTLENAPLIPSRHPVHIVVNRPIDVGEIWEIWMPEIFQHGFLSHMRVQMCIFKVYYFRKYTMLNLAAVWSEYKRGVFTQNRYFANPLKIFVLCVLLLLSSKLKILDAIVMREIFPYNVHPTYRLSWPVKGMQDKETLYAIFGLVCGQSN